ncbi:DUF4426 domain-containing protein [Glaciecola petra]|uniref:DUF4426 domain-containing protein n=1 Tax=Glaciecola petra TaxID=3075602 RepID=A0ABU2ZPR9_9ALTE|nr:DUF4426 domain-containing protein [Aestuariibacter sp. P117]MDT0593452.1 DUF4426 domain-containing protein [Aestuariibacter sp. P117]
MKLNITHKWLIASMIGLFCMHANSEQKKTLGDWDIHYIAFNTTILTPQIAKANNIVRSGKRALVNISVLDKQTKEAQEIVISGSARNLLGTKKVLDFKKVNEGDAIYYLATVDYSDKEVLRFDIDIQQGRISQNLKFQQTMYVED